MSQLGLRTETDPARPARMMADIVKSELGVVTTPEAIVDLFKKRWATLSLLAHEIHQANEFLEKSRHEPV